jgi:hypothetical protein
MVNLTLCLRAPSSVDGRGVHRSAASETATVFVVDQADELDRLGRATPCMKDVSKSVILARKMPGYTYNMSKHNVPIIYPATA